MVEVVEAEEWDFKLGGMDQLFLISLQEEQDIYRIAEILNLPYIFKKKRSLICSDGVFLFRFTG